MIDYEKLKLAHELAEKLCDEIGRRVDINVIFIEKNDYAFGLQSYNEDIDYPLFNTLDGLITKLKELTRPKPKFEVGQEIWCLDNKEIKSFKIDEIIYDIEYWYINKHDDGKYSNDEEYFDQFQESSLFATKQELIQAQIDYWQSQLTKEHVKSYEKASMELINEHIKHCGIKLELKECQHECDGKFHERCPAMRKCTKCNKLYPLFELCQHEPDLTGISNLTHPAQNYMKCKKCGEFYR